MPPKKKKTQLKKVERGFATTSIPKKVQATPAIEEDASAVQQAPKETPGTDVQDSELDERSSILQNFVDKLQDKTEKEIQRTLKAIEYERRSMKNLPRLDLDEATQSEIQDLLKDCGTTSNTGISSRPSESRDKYISQIGITYGVLRRLGFKEELVLECLKEASDIDLEAAFDWLYLHCPADDLNFSNRPDGSFDNSTSHTPRTPDFSSSPGTPQLIVKKGLPTQFPQDAPTESPLKSVDTSAKSDDPAYDSDPNSEFVRLRLRVDDLTGNRRRTGEGASDELLKELRQRLEVVKKSYFFNERDAQADYAIKRRQADEAALTSQLRGEGERKPPFSDKPKDDKLTSVVKPSTGQDIFEEGDDDNSSEGLFGILEPMPTVETSEHGTTVLVRDMSLPKRWTGKLPKSLLTDLVSSSDRYAAIAYRVLSGGSRAKRSSVTIRWTGGRLSEWCMNDIACHDLGQAEQYIATIALYALTYPSAEGFQSAIGNAKGAQTSFRHLPPAFRDLWNELEESRKESENISNREIWGRLASIADQKLASMEKTSQQIRKDLHPSDSRNHKERATLEYSPDQLIASFQARQASNAYQTMLAQRNTLPIAAYRQTIIEMLGMSQVMVLSGETGCGKSTQLPSFILEDQLSTGRPCKIVVTEPRRISAISLAQRVSRELGDPPGVVGTSSSLIGYSIRLESHTSKNTRLTFVTNGIALRMLEGGSGLEGRGTAFDEITHIVVDEVHERSIESDFLLIVLKSLLEQRKDLKVILMSATLDAEKISNYFGGCPTLHVPGRTFPIDVRFLEDAIEYCQWSITDSSPYAKRLNDKFHRTAKKMEWSEDLLREDEEEGSDGTHDATKLQAQRYSPSTVATMNLLDERMIPYDLIIRLLETICFGDPSVIYMSSAFLLFMPGLGEIRRLNDMLSEHPRFGSSDEFHLYPLHSMISSENQSAVFDIPPLGIRKIVIATNIAETGITIPDITCVIDSGKHREMRFDEKRQISRLIEAFIAKSNAAQRRGRAGRVQSGLCFHLFSRARQELMADHPLPEMTRLSLSDLALRIKIMKVNLGVSIEDVLTRALDPPSSINIQRAISALVEVQALTSSEEITPMGRLLSKLPTDVHLGKFLLISALFRCLDPALTIAAALNSKSPFLSPFGHEDEATRAKNTFRSGDSDFLTICNAFSSWRRASENPSFVRKFCRVNFLSHQNLQQIEELRQQFLGYLVDSSFIHVDQEFVRELNHARYSRGRTRFVAVPTEYNKNNTENMALLNAALCAGLHPKLLTIDASNGAQQMRTLGNNQTVAFHPTSVNFGRRPTDFGANYLCYFTIMQSKRLYAWETGPVDDLAVVLLCGLDCDFKLISDAVIIDRKIRFRLTPKTSVALKHIRAHMMNNLASQFEGKGLSEHDKKWDEIALRILGKVKHKNSAGLGIIVY